MRGVFIIETWYNTVGRRHLVWAVAVLAMVGLSGCETFDFLSSEEPPLPGKRISIMTFNQRLESDPALADLEVRLPAPYVNAAWSQGCQHVEVFGNFVGAVVLQHDAAGADPDAAGFGQQMGDQDFGR